MARSFVSVSASRARFHTIVRNSTWTASPISQCRPFGTTPSFKSQPNLTASQAVDKLLSSFTNASTVRRQILDANQLQKLSLTLGRRELDGVDVSENPPPTGTPVPPGWHLVYFTPNGLESQLGADGTDRSFNAPAPFTRRMWAGGRMKWLGNSNDSNSPLLRVGDEVEERTKFVSATAKKNKAGREMVLVEIEKEFWGPRGLSLVDQRSWIFQTEISPGNPKTRKALDNDAQGPTRIENVAADNKAFPRRRMQWSPVGLFRFSALTFNGHKIHYNEDWTRDVEGHPGQVVHGPINLVSILDYWRDIHGSGSIPKEISYRALSPIYVGETYDIRTDQVQGLSDGKSYDIVADKSGVLCMKASIKGDSS